MHTTPPPASPLLRAEAFRRSRDDTMLLGVCAGVGRALGIAPLWIRLGVLGLVAILPALGLLLYALLGVVVRRDDGRLALGGHPRDSRETVVGWGLVALAAFGATTADSGFPRPLLLLAVAAAAAVVAQTARRGASQGDELPALPAPPAEAPTEPMPAEPPTEPIAAATPAPGPSLVAIGIGVLALVAVVGVLFAPTGLAAAGASRLIASGAGVLGILALAGVITAIACAGRRHAGGLLVLSLVVGLLAVWMASVHDQVGSQPALDWLLQRTADLLWVNR